MKHRVLHLLVGSWLAWTGATAQLIENTTFIRRSFVRNYYNLSMPFATVNMKGTHLFEANGNSLVISPLKGNMTARQEYGKLCLSAGEESETIVRCSEFNPFLCYEIDIDGMRGAAVGAAFYRNDLGCRMTIAKSTDGVKVAFVKDGLCIDSAYMACSHPMPMTLRVQLTGARMHIFLKGNDCDSLLLSREIPKSLYCKGKKRHWNIDDCHDWSFGLYTLLQKGGECQVSRIETFFSSGTGQADPSIVQDKGGMPYIRDNRLYVALTTRGFEQIPDSHQGIYSIDISTMEWRKESVLLFQRDGDRRMHPYHATKIVWDSDEQEWLLMTVSHGEDHQLVWARSKSDILHGLHFLDTHALNEPYYDTRTDEDPDFLWDPKRKQWMLAYVSILGKKGYQTVLCESSQWNGGYRKVAVSDVGNETGTRLLQTPDGLRVLSGGDSYNILEYPSLRRIGELNTVFPDGGFRGWASIAPVPSDQGYDYLWITFDRGRTLGRYSYGTLYHFIGRAGKP